MIIKQLLKGESQPQHVPGGGCSDCPSEDQCHRGGLPSMIYVIKRPKKPTSMFTFTDINWSVSHKTVDLVSMKVSCVFLLTTVTPVLQVHPLFPLDFDLLLIQGVISNICL